VNRMPVLDFAMTHEDRPATEPIAARTAA